MPNQLNRMMKEELAAFLASLSDCVVVDFQGLTVEELSGIRAALDKTDISMQVVKTSLVRLLLKELDRQGGAELFKGPSAVIFGGPDVVGLTKAVGDLAKRNKSLRIKGGLLETRPITPELVIRLTQIPDRKTLLAGIAGGIGAPLQGVYNCIAAILRNIAYAIDAVREKAEQREKA